MPSSGCQLCLDGGSCAGKSLASLFLHLGSSDPRDGLLPCPWSQSSFLSPSLQPCWVFTSTRVGGGRRFCCPSSSGLTLSSHRGEGFQEVFCFPGGAGLTPAVAPLCPVPAERPRGGLSTGARRCVLFRPLYVMTGSRRLRAPGRGSAMTVGFGSSVLANLAAREPNARRGGQQVRGPVHCGA